MAEAIHICYKNASVNRILAPEEVFSLRSSQSVFTSLATQAANKSWGLPFLAYHTERVTQSAKQILGATNWTPADLQTILIEHLRQEKQLQGERIFIRLIIHSDMLEIVLMNTKRPWSDLTPLKALSVEACRPQATHKTNQTEISKTATRKAEAGGADIAILVNSYGKVLEAAWSNLFWYDRDANLNTTKGELLPGVIRRVIIENEPVREKEITLEKLLLEARELFISNSVAGIQPISEIDSKRLTSIENTRALSSRLNQLTQENITFLNYA